ncbi:MAG: DNA integrity scanning protein DisA nucleotide-binding domain protein [Desulfotignum sp.]
MDQSLYRKLCVANIMNGVTEGLSKFSHPSRVALIFAPDPDDPVMVLDPQDLLRGHGVKVHNMFSSEDGGWRTRVITAIKSQPRGHQIPENDLALAGLISYGCSCSDFFYQAWFTEHHPDLCSIYPTQRWLEQAATLLIHDYNGRSAPVNSSEYVLKNYALQAVADHILDKRDRNLAHDSRLQVPAILNKVLDLSKTKEEGFWPRGVLFFCDPDQIGKIEFITRIQKHQQPQLFDIKHVRKLLVAVEDSDRKLVSDGKTIVGITDGPVPDDAIAAHFKGDYGFLDIKDNRIASFFDGSFHSITREARLVELEELLLDTDVETGTATVLFQMISRLVHRAGRCRHGCTLVIDLNDPPMRLSGHVLDPPLSLMESRNFELASALLKIDGAVHLTSDSSIHGFACLLDGRTIDWEKMARGARYNSALRFSTANSGIIVVVVSADRPVSIIYNGIEISAFSNWRPVSQQIPEPVFLDNLLNGVNL